ncbi:MAG: RimK family alpha-L-glutamate ligase [Microgenomates group bacterium]
MKRQSLWFCPILNPSIYEHDRVLEEAGKLDIDFRKVQLNSVRLQISTKKTNLFLENEQLELPDAAWVRIGPLHTSAHEQSIMIGLESQIKLCVNPLQGRLHSDQKLKTLQVITQKGVPIPKTIIAPFPFSIEDIENQLPYPLVLKPDSGAQGMGVVLIENRKQLRSIISLLQYLKLHEIFLVQEYISYKKGTDIRVWVVGNTVLGAIRRTAVGDSFATNFSAGGSVEMVKASSQMVDISVKAAKALGLHIAGIDLLETKDGYVVCEVNANPGFKGFESVTGINVPQKVIHYMMSKASKS